MPGTTDLQPKRQRLVVIGVLLLVVVMTAVAYAPALRGEFVWDDTSYVRDNPTLRDGAGLRRIWLEPQATPQYHPLVFSSFWLEYHLWGPNPFGYHLTNIALHALNVSLLWLLLRSLAVPGALLGAALFALHPVHVESVAWIAERKDVLSGTFAFLTLLAWWRWAATRRRRRYAAALALFACTLLSKSVLCTLPLVMLLLVWWKHPSRGCRSVGEVAPFVAMSVAMGVLTAWREYLYGNPPLPLSLIHRVLIASRALWFYAAKLLWPTALAAIYPKWEIPSVGAWWLACPVATLTLLASLWWFRRRAGAALVAVLAFILMLLPILGLVDFNYMRFSYVADHFQYLASASLLALGAAGATLAVRRLQFGGREVVIPATCLLLALLALLTWQRAELYGNPEALWRDTIAKNPNAWMAHHNLATILVKQGKVDEALPHFAAAVEINPDYAEAHNHWGIVLDMQGKLDEALEQYNAALRINPAQADAHNNAGTVLVRQGKLDAAVEHFAAAVRIKPDYAEAYNHWGIAATKQGKLDEAMRHFADALRLKPDLASARTNLERIRAQAEAARAQ